MVSVNNNINTLYIDGKPVRKASLGGKVFYEKHNYHLGLVASPSSILVGGTSVVTATLTDWNIPIEGETIDFDCTMSTVVDETGVYDFGDYYEIDISQLPAYSSDMNTPHKYPVYISDSNYPRIGFCSDNMAVSLPTGGLSAYLNGAEKIIIKNGTISYTDRWGVQHHVDISMLENLTRWGVNSGSVTINQYIQETETTDSNGECSINYFGEFDGELNIRANVSSLSLEEETQVNIFPDAITSIELTGEPDIIQTGETSDIYAIGFADEGLHVGSGHTIHFFERVEPTINVSASQSIIQTSGTTELYAKVKDSDGSLAQNVKVHFYEVEEEE